MKIRSASLREVLLLAAFAVCSSASTLHAAWTSFDLPSLAQDFGTYQAANLSDGRFLFGTTSQLYRQTAFGAAAITPFANPQSWDPSSVAVSSDTLGAIGSGTFGPSSIYTFNPSDTSTPFAPIPGLSIQNYNLVFRNASSLYVAGSNGSALGPFGSNENAVSYVTLDGGTNKVIIDNVSAFSGGIAIDLQGNLYVTTAYLSRGPERFEVVQIHRAATHERDQRICALDHRWHLPDHAAGGRIDRRGWARPHLVRGLPD